MTTRHLSPLLGGLLLTALLGGSARAQAYPAPPGRAPSVVAGQFGRDGSPAVMAGKARSSVARRSSAIDAGLHRTSSRRPTSSGSGYGRSGSSSGGGRGHSVGHAASAVGVLPSTPGHSVLGGSLALPAAGHPSGGLSLPPRTHGR